MPKNRDPDISVIIATYNRAPILNETLKHLSTIERNGLDVEFLIVDNNSTDNTKETIESFKGKLPIRYLFEPKAGQNCARNRALSEEGLGKIVVFTDDDIEPETDWLEVINSACRQWPEYEIFGGNIYPVWPSNIKIPKWTKIQSIQELVFAAHKYKNRPGLYEKGDYPFSGNFWMRRNLVDKGVRFDNSIEWQPRNRILATETILFRNLTEQGYRIVHYPQAAVGHKISAEQLTIKNLLKRSYSCGRGIAHIRTFCRSEMLNKNPLLWYGIRYTAIGRIGFQLAGALMPLALKKPQPAMRAMQWLGFNIELLNLAEQYNKQR